MSVRPSDAEVVRSVLAGNREDYSQLVDTYEARVFSLLMRMTSNRQDAEDLCQETFYRAYISLASYRDEYRFAPWLMRIAHNLCVNHLRRPKAALGVEPAPEAEPSAIDGTADPAPSPERLAENYDAYSRVWQAVSELPAQLREIVVLRHLQEFSYREISLATGLPMGTVKSRLSRARNELAHQLADEGAI